MPVPTTLPPRFARRILWASTLTWSSILSAAYNGLPINFVLACSVYATTLNYWRRPTYGWRRNVDILCSCGSLGYQALVTAFQTSEAGRHAYWAAVAAGCACYLGGRYVSKTSGNLNLSSRLHVGVHLMGNVGNVCLYDSLGANVLGLGGPGAAEMSTRVS